MKHDHLPPKVSRRTLLRAGLASTGAALLAACGAPTTTGSSTAPASSAAASSAPASSAAASTAAGSASTQAVPAGTAGKLAVLQRQEYFQAVETKFRDTVTQFIAGKNAQLDISTVNPEAFGDFIAKMQAAVQAGNPPDLAYHTNSVQQLYFLDTMVDVTDVVEEAIAKYGAVVPITAEKNAKIDGKWWSVPFQSNSGAWFARTDLFEAAGIDVATLDTWDKRREAALKVSKPDQDTWGWGMTINKSGDGHGVIMGVIQAYGGSITDQAGQKVVFNSPQTVQAVKWLQETYTGETYKPMLPPGIESWTDPTNNETYLAGNSALTLNAFSVYAKMKQDGSDLLGKTAVLRAPLSNTGERLEAGGNGWFSIFRGAKNVDLAKETILHVLNPDNFLPMVREGGGLFMPAYRNLWTDDVLAIDPNFATLRDIMFNETPYTGIAYPADPSPAIDQVLAASIPSEMMANVTTGKMSAEQAVEDAHNKIVNIFEELGLPQ